MSIDLKVKLEEDDCFFLNDLRNTAEARKKRAGTWYCSIQNRYFNDKWFKKHDCKYYQSVKEMYEERQKEENKRIQKDEILDEEEDEEKEEEDEYANYSKKGK